MKLSRGRLSKLSRFEVGVVFNCLGGALLLIVESGMAGWVVAMVLVWMGRRLDWL